jgi:hypothetical protein
MKIRAIDLATGEVEIGADPLGEAANYFWRLQHHVAGENMFQAAFKAKHQELSFRAPSVLTLKVVSGMGHLPRLFNKSTRS